MEHQTTQLQDATLPLEQDPHRVDPLGDGISSVALVRASGSDVDVANAARVSYGKVTDVVTERDKKLIHFLLAHNHTSPFEHNQISFRIKAPIFVARQWMRHRMHSYNEISYRYVKAPVEFYIPTAWRFQDTQNKQASVGAFENKELLAIYKASIEQSYKAYEQLLEQGVCREMARATLPVCTYTEFIFTSNLHALMHFLKLRLGAGAQKEIRNYAAALLALALPHFPVSLGIWQELYVPEIKDEFTELFTKYAG
ncbi:MAG TPA: FAD-dependent thymidylate synthase [Candidatus Babeliales bacterium]|nr:FAD-dependent thymidylate synthase [Candidatus Babeliales bacterium]